MHPAPIAEAAAIMDAGISVTFNDLHAVNDVTFAVKPGECFGIVGESGSGKTTVLRSILGLQPIEAGAIDILGRRQPYRGRNFARQSGVIQPIFQDPASSLSPRRRIGQLMDEVGEVLGEKRDSLRARLEETLRRLGLPRAVVDQSPHQLSGGLARRAAIARALLFNPKIIAADEPTAGLDVSVQGDLLNLLQEIRSATGITMLVISHNLAVVRLIADNVAVMQKGRIVEQGSPAEVLEQPKSAYAQQLLAAWPRAIADTKGSL
jgi:peptide/nickel transport system ATP-binding protein